MNIDELEQLWYFEDKLVRVLYPEQGETTSSSNQHELPRDGEVVEKVTATVLDQRLPFQWAFNVVCK